MFDFPQWREWLREWTDDLAALEYAAEWTFNDRHLRGVALSVTGRERVGSFRSFENGLVDYDIADAKSGSIVANGAMIQVDDQNFVVVFQQFVMALNGSNEDSCQKSLGHSCRTWDSTHVSAPASVGRLGPGRHR